MAHAITELATLLCAVFGLAIAQPSPHNSCRFATRYSLDAIAQNATSFVHDIVYWEAQFHASQVAYNLQTGVTYDGCLLDQITGLANLTERHEFSAASKEVT